MLFNRTTAACKCLVTAIFLCGSGKAATQQTTQISYSGVIPPAVKSVVPRRGKSLFFGAATISKQPLFFHFYTTRPSREANYGSSSHNYCALDVMVKRVLRGKSRFTRLSSTPVYYRSLLKPSLWKWKSSAKGARELSSRFKMEQLWLDAQQQVPVVRFNFESSVSDGRSLGDDLLFVFPSGLSKIGLSQHFAYGMFTGGSVDQRINTFDTVDEQDAMVVKVEELSTVGRETILWKWSGQEFTVAQKSWHVWSDDT